MKRGLEILFLWLIVIGSVDFFLPFRSVPRNGMEVTCDHLTVLAFPLAAWVYARHSGRVAPVICFGFIVGVFCALVPLPLFHDARGMLRREFTIRQELLVWGVPVLMTLLCLGVFAFKRWLDKEDAHHA